MLCLDALQTTQFENVRRLTKILGPIVFSLWSIMEPFRLNLGVTGNLKEKVSQACYLPPAGSSCRMNRHSHAGA